MSRYMSDWQIEQLGCKVCTGAPVMDYVTEEELEEEWNAL